VGADCTCPSIKNYPTMDDLRLKDFFITPGALNSFLPRGSAERDPAEDE